MMRRGWTYHRVTRTCPCVICGKPDWCRDGSHADGRTLALFNRVVSDRPARREGGGWLHDVSGPAVPRLNGAASALSSPRLSTAELEIIDRQCRTTLSPAHLAVPARRLCVSAATLMRLSVGWHDGRAAFTFPMRNDAGRLVGLRTRYADGGKRCLAGSLLGLNMLGRSWNRPDVLLVTEGESDAAAAINLGFEAIARRGCGACTSLVIAFVERLRPGRVALIADADPLGQCGADALARQLAEGGTASRVLTLPDGAKDLRAWKLLPHSNCHALAALIDAPANRTEDCDVRTAHTAPF